MGRRKGNLINGWINLDKPEGLTSTQALGAVKRILKPAKAGHAGTLDPLATGILPIALGEATKIIPYAQDAEKTYSFTVHWGEERDTNDAEGEITNTADKRPAPDEITKIIPEFTGGNIKQVPPSFSAVKIQGERAYDLAREGHEVELKEREVFIRSLELLENGKDSASFKMTCGKGTYVRSLARDMGQRLGTFGYISSLRREAVGPFNENNAISLDILEKMSECARLEEALLPLQTVLDDIPALALKDQEASKLKNGQKLVFISAPDMKRLENAGMEVIAGSDYTALGLLDGKPVAMVNVTGAEVKPVRIFNL
jgi:tRNA pseudouridine55 synthase